MAKSKPVKKKNAPELSPEHPGNDKQTHCEAILQHVNQQLTDRKGKRANSLRSCSDCEIDDANALVLSSPFDASLLNTGHNGAGGIINSGAGTDLYWEVGLGTPSGPGSVSTWIPAFVFRLAPTWVASPFTNANWISLYADGSHSGNIDVYFRNRFYLSGAINPSQFFLDMSFYADNSVHDIYINGVAQSSHYPADLPQASGTPYGHRGFDPGTGVEVSLREDWQACENEMIVHVKSGQSYIGFLAQNTSKCYEAELPELAPTIDIRWGDSECDCMETDDVEVFSISVCNPYANVSFKNLVIGQITIVDAAGNPVATLPDGTPSAEVIPAGPHCFGDLCACRFTRPGEPVNPCSCATREFVLRTRGAKSGAYKLKLEGICFEVCHEHSVAACFELKLCKD